MAEAIIEKQICEKCGVDVRDNTQFCYNCGSSVSVPQPTNEVETGETADPAAVSGETQAALDDLAARLKIEEPTEEKLARAADERKKARVERRKPKDYTWVPMEETSTIRLLATAILIAVLVGVVVLFGVWWR